MSGFSPFYLFTLNNSEFVWFWVSYNTINWSQSWHWCVISCLVKFKLMEEVTPEDEEFLSRQGFTKTNATTCKSTRSNGHHYSKKIMCCFLLDIEAFRPKSMIPNFERYSSSARIRTKDPQESNAACLNVLTPHH